MVNEEFILNAKIDDAVRASKSGARFLGFLDPGQVMECIRYTKYNKDANFHFFGGYLDADRKYLAVYPDYYEADDLEFPITAISFTFRKQDKLSHRDFLGVLMAQGITRSSLGDILLEEGRAVIFIKSELADYVAANIEKIGRIGVKSSIGYLEPLPQLHKFKERSGVIASKRLDCLISAICNLSREKAANLIKSDMVFVNYKEQNQTSYLIDENDIISVRKHGKFIVDTIGPVTKKGRLSYRCREYI